MTGSKKHPKPLKTRELGKAKIERRLAASWRFRFSWNFAGRRPWVTGSKKHLKPLKTRELGKAKIERRLTASWRLRFSWNFAGRRPWVTDHQRRCRGRDASCLAPPARIRTSAIDAYGSYLGWVTAKRCSG